MKALEKDRHRRYETANDFAADVMRYLTDQPVEACPPSASYRLTKFARRNRVVLSTVAVVAAALVLGTVVSTWQAIRAEAGERQAQANLKKAREAVDQMLVRVAGRLANVPHMEQVRRELLADSLRFYEAFLQEQGTDPEVRFETAMAHMQFGKMQRMLGEHRPAEQAFLDAQRIFRQLAAEAPDNRDYRFNFAQSYNEVGKLMDDRGHLTEAEQAYQQALEITRKLDADFPGHYRGWIAGRLNNIGIILMKKGQLAEAERVHREALAFRTEFDPNGWVLFVETYSNLAHVLFEVGRHDEAVNYFRKSLEFIQKRTIASPGVQNFRHDLADCSSQPRGCTGGDQTVSRGGEPLQGGSGRQPATRGRLPGHAAIPRIALRRPQQPGQSPVGDRTPGRGRGGAQEKPGITGETGRRFSGIA